jgi:hypothetical protein
LVFCLLIPLSGLFAQRNEISIGRFTDLSLRLSTTKLRFLPNEPIPVNLELINETRSPILGHSSLRFTSGFVEVKLRNPAGNEREVKPLSLDRVFSVGKESSILPGTHLLYSELLKLDLMRHFPATGIYNMQVEFKSRDRRTSVRSNWINIEIVQPSLVEIEALQFLKKIMDVGTIYTAPNVAKNLESYAIFVERFADTPYTPYIRLHLASYYKLVGLPDKALVQIDALQNLKDFPLSTRVMEIREELMKKQNR